MLYLKPEPGNLLNDDLVLALEMVLDFLFTAMPQVNYDVSQNEERIFLTAVVRLFLQQ